MTPISWGDVDWRNLGREEMANYPRGKFADDDEGETDLAILVQDKTVIIAFTKPMNWIGMDKQSALAIGNLLIQRANEIEDLAP